MSYTIWPDGPTGDMLQRVNAERYRQEELKRRGKFPWSCADSFQPLNLQTISGAEKLAVLAEEFGEVAEIVCKLQANCAEAKGLTPKHLQEELIQVAAVCVAWAESLEQ